MLQLALKKIKDVVLVCKNWPVCFTLIIAAPRLPLLFLPSSKPLSGLESYKVPAGNICLITKNPLDQSFSGNYVSAFKALTRQYMDSFSWTAYSKHSPFIGQMGVSNKWAQCGGVVLNVQVNVHCELHNSPSHIERIATLWSFTLHQSQH